MLRKPPKYVISTKVSVLCELLVHNCSKCSPTFATSLVVPDPKSKSYCSHSSVQDRRVPISQVSNRIMSLRRSPSLPTYSHFHYFMGTKCRKHAKRQNDKCLRANLEPDMPSSRNLNRVLPRKLRDKRAFLQWHRTPWTQLDNEFSWEEENITYASPT